MKRALIIEDEEGIRQTLGLYSEMLGYEAVEVENPHACDVFHTNGSACTAEKACADILIVDQNLKETTGLEFIEYQLDKGCKLPPHRKAVVAGSLTEREFRVAKRLGCHVLQKPVTFEILENWVSKIDNLPS